MIISTNQIVAFGGYTFQMQGCDWLKASPNQSTIENNLTQKTRCNKNFHKPKIMLSETVEAGLAIISQLLSDGQVEAFKDFSQIMPIFAKSALENRKNPSWQFSLDLVTQIFELIEKSSSAPGNPILFIRFAVTINAY